jgi:hypothetical protein
MKLSPEALAHAEVLRNKYGHKKALSNAKGASSQALAKAKEKLADAAYMVNGDVDFWRQVVAALEGESLARLIK